MCGNFLYFCKMQEYVKKSPTMDCSSHVYECGRGPLGASYAIKSCARSSYMSGSVLSGANKRHAALECDPLHGRRCRRHLQGGNGRIGSTRGGSAGVLGPDLVLKCSYGLTYHNQVEKYVGQRPFGESQRPRSSGQPG